MPYAPALPRHWPSAKQASIWASLSGRIRTVLWMTFNTHNFRAWPSRHTPVMT